MKKFLICFVIAILLLAIIIGNCSDEGELNDDLPSSTIESVEEEKEILDLIDNTPEEISDNTEDISENPLPYDPNALEIPKTIRHVPEQILVRYAYTTSYNNETKCPNWVAWHLYGEKANGNNKRDGVPYYDENGNVLGIKNITSDMIYSQYMIDPEVKSPRQEHIDWEDYIPGNSHGHICPAADCRWSKEAINQTFLLTNICPQDLQLNTGDWEGLESRCRGWAKHYKDIYIVSGPIFYNGITKTMGINKVGIPDAFFKVILCNNKKIKALGFIFPNEGTHHKLDYYMLSVDEVEEKTGFDFFCNLPDSVESVVESISDLSKW